MTTITEDNLFHSTCFYLYLYLNTKQVCDYVSIFFKSRFLKLEIKKISMKAYFQDSSKNKMFRAFVHPKIKHKKFIFEIKTIFET